MVTSKSAFRIIALMFIVLVWYPVLVFFVHVYCRYVVGSPRTNGFFTNGSHQSKSNGAVTKLSSTLPTNYNILTSSDLLVGMHSATGSPRAKGISAS